MGGGQPPRRVQGRARALSPRRSPAPVRGADASAPLITATIVPDVTGLDKTFDYVVPDALRDLVRVGSRVRAPLAGRRIGGWVVRVGAPAGEVAIERLVPLALWSGHGPSEEILDLAEWAAQRWGSGRLRPFLVTASPPTNVRSLPASQRRPPGPLAGASAAIRRLLADGGGVVRATPQDDPLPAVLAAVERGPVLVVHPHPDSARLLAAALRGAGRTVAVLPDEWAAAVGGVDVVIGGRGAAFAPVPDVAAFVVVDEHDEALQEERTPTWHARDVLIERARRRGVPCLLVSPCPSVTALSWAGKRWMRPPAAAELADWPAVHVVDRSGEEPWRRSLLTGPLIAALRDPTARVVCVHNAPGRARLLACRSCRSLVVCARCDASVAQLDDGQLHCARCGTHRPPVCQVCGSSALSTVRPGISRLREELEAAAGRPVVAVTGQSDDELPPADVHVGTEAVLHRIREADVVAILDLDAELLAPRYRAVEQAFALLVRAARLVGPRGQGGRLLLQTFLPQHVAVQAAVFADPSRVAKAEAARRRDLGLPPFGALAAVAGEGAAAFVRDAGLLPAGPDDDVLVRAPTWDDLGPALARTPRPKGSRLRVEVDPPRR